MTVASETDYVTYTGNGSTAAFTFSFEVFSTSDIRVVTRTNGGSDNSVQVLNADYTVSLTAGGASGGTVTFTTAPASGVTILIRRDRSSIQNTDLKSQGTFSAANIEAALDEAFMAIQELKFDVARSLKVKEIDSLTFDGEVPTAVVTTANANKAIVINSTATGLDVADISATAQATADLAAWKSLTSSAYGSAVGDNSEGSATANTTALQAAITAVASSGGTLYVPEGVFIINASITGTLTHASGLTIKGPGVIKASSSIAFNTKMFDITGNGRDLNVEDITIDCNDRAKVGFEVTQSSDAENDLTFKNVKVKNVWLESGSSQTAAGIRCAGGFRHVTFDNCKVVGVNRKAGISGGLCFGISASVVSTYWIKNVTAKGCLIENVWNGEPLLGADNNDCDGIHVVGGYDGASSSYQDTSLTVSDCTFKNCKGRSVKIQRDRVSVSNCNVIRKIAGLAGGFGEINLQATRGTVDGCSFYYQDADDWASGGTYKIGEVVVNNGINYRAIYYPSHVAGSDNDEPGVGANTATYWEVYDGTLGAGGGVPVTAFNTSTGRNRAYSFSDIHVFSNLSFAGSLDAIIDVSGSTNIGGGSSKNRLSASITNVHSDIPSKSFCKVSSYGEDSWPAGQYVFVKSCSSRGLIHGVISSTSGSNTENFSNVSVDGFVNHGFPITLKIDSTTKANPCVIETTAPHGLTTGDYVTIEGSDHVELNGVRDQITVLTSTTFEMDNTDSSLDYQVGSRGVVRGKDIVTSISNSDPAVATTDATHGLSRSQVVFIADGSLSGGTAWADQDNKGYIVGDVTANTFELLDQNGDDVDFSSEGASWTGSAYITGTVKPSFTTGDPKSASPMSIKMEHVFGVELFGVASEEHGIGPFGLTGMTDPLAHDAGATGVKVFSKLLHGGDGSGGGGESWTIPQKIVGNAVGFIYTDTSGHTLLLKADLSGGVQLFNTGLSAVPATVTLGTTPGTDPGINGDMNIWITSDGYLSLTNELGSARNVTLVLFGV